MGRRRAQAEPAKLPQVTVDDLNETAKDEVTDDELIAIAQRSAGDMSEDTEEAIEELFVLQARKAYFNDAQPGGKRYKELRELVTKRLAEGGPRLFSHRGRKFVAVRKQAIPVEYRDEVVLEEFAGKPELLDQIMPRKIDKTAFKRACQRGDITPAQLAAICYFGKGNAPFVRYITIPDD